jgi:membrane protease YdiL (CAAX protease family)
MIDRKGVLSYLAITFGITYAVEGALILAGFRVTALPSVLGQYTIALVMWVPALATLLTVKLITREGWGVTRFRIGSLWPYLVSALVVPASFIVVYGLTWALGLGQPDWQLTNFYALIASTGADMSSAPPPALLLVVLFLASLFVAPWFNSLFGLGEEIGWRGYLLPKLMPLGKIGAYIVVGVIWGLWHAPLILVGFNYPGYPILGIVFMAGMTTALGIFMNELALRYRSSILAGWIHGLFNSQGYGVWRILFPTVNPLLGGFTGLVGIAVWLIVGLVTGRRLSSVAKDGQVLAQAANVKP